MLKYWFSESYHSKMLEEMASVERLKTELKLQS